MQDELLSIDSNSIDSIVTDPPYELGFMGKSWDSSGVAFQKETWEHCYRILKPGGYLLAFGGSRTYHRIACAIEDAGFEIRDTIMWLYGSGFPKSMNIGLAIDKKDGVDNRTGNIVKGRGSKDCGVRCFSDDNYEWKSEIEEREAQNEWKGWGTSLKPSYEPIIVARKPFKGSCVDNVLEYGVGGINIDECRVPFNGDKWNTQKSGKSSRAFQSEELTTAGGICVANENGRFPSNTILTYDETDFDEVCGGFPATNCGDSPSRYFYCAKASKKDRDEGLEEFEEKDGIRSDAPRVNEEEKTKPRKNIHPTVKPTTLMQYLVRLVTPKGGTVLDPFMGSGSTGKATMIENVERNADYKFIGIEMTEEYLPICKARIDFGCGYVVEDDIHNSVDVGGNHKNVKVSLW